MRARRFGSIASSSTGCRTRTSRPSTGCRAPTRDRDQGPPLGQVDQVVLAIAEEDEVQVEQPLEERDGLGDLLRRVQRGARRGDLDHAAGGVAHRVEVAHRQLDVPRIPRIACSSSVRSCPVRPLLELEVHQRLAVRRLLRTCTIRSMRPSGPRSIADHRVDHATNGQTPRLELLVDRVVQERGVGRADLDHRARGLVPVAGTLGSNTRTANSSGPRASASSNAPRITPRSSSGGAGLEVLRRHAPVNADAKARTSSARSAGTLASMSSSTRAGRPPVVTSSVVLTPAHGTRARTGLPTRHDALSPPRRPRGYRTGSERPTHERMCGPAGPPGMVETSNRMSGTVEEHELRSVAQLRMLHALASRLNALDDIDAIGEAITTELKTLIDYHNCRIYLLLDDGETLWPTSSGGSWRVRVRDRRGARLEGRRGDHRPRGVHRPRRTTRPTRCTIRTATRSRAPTRSTSRCSRCRSRSASA